MASMNYWGVAFGYDFSGLAELKNRAAAVRNMLADKNVLIILDDKEAAAYMHNDLSFPVFNSYVKIAIGCWFLHQVAFIGCS